MERKNTGQLSLACTGNLRDNRQPRRLGSVLPSSNAIKRRYLERAHIKGRTDVIRRQIGNNINILLSFCCAVEQGMRSEPGGGDSHMKQTGMLVGNFEFNP